MFDTAETSEVTFDAPSSDQLISKLTDDQAEAWAVLEPELKADYPTTASLQGYAGTGKTFMVTAIAEHLLEEGYDVSVAALTHQAKYVLRNEMPPAIVDDVYMNTIHSVLGLKLVPDNEGGEVLVRDDSREPNLPESPDSVIIVDEASMQGMQLWEYTEEAFGKTPASWLFVGDPAQLPPVMDKESPALWQDPTVQLERIVRQAKDNPIIRCATAIRNGRSWKKYKNNCKRNGEGEVVGISTTTKQENFVGSACSKFDSDTYSDNPYHARILCAHNDAVRQMNHLVKAKIYPGASEWVEGMWGIVQTSWAPDQEIRAYTSEMLQIKECSKRTAAVASKNSFDSVRLPIWEMEVASERGPLSLDVLASEGKRQYEEEIEKRKEYAKKNGGGGAWRPYYALKERLCDFRYPYASTVHKAQGMSLDAAYINMRDIRTFNKNWQEMRYVAFTRARDQVAVLI